MDFYNKNIDNISLLKKKNKYEDVFVGRIKISGKKIIIKRFNKYNKKAYESFLKEKNVNFKHKNLNQLLDAYENKNHCFIIRNYIHGKDLKKYNIPIFKRKSKKQKFYLKCTLEALEGLKKLHSNKIIHNDIRPSNLLLSLKDKKNLFKKPDIKITDFGQAKIKKNPILSYTSAFALIYSSPEQVLKLEELINESSDIYMLGVSLWVLLSGKIPFSHKIPEVIANLQLTYKLPKNHKIDKKIYKIISKATSKIELKKPPSKYSKSNLKSLIFEGQSKRYQSADEMIIDLKNILV